MEKKLHIKAVANGNVKIDAFWYKYGDDIDCYMTPNMFKTCIFGNAFKDFDIILDENTAKKEEIKITEVLDDGNREQVSELKHDVGKAQRQNKSKASV